jgi:hypothetical protein
MEGEFEPTAAFEERITRCLRDTFREHDLIAFDIQVTERPPGLTDDVRDFWGGYLVEFKLSMPAAFARLADNLETLRRQALPIGVNNSTKFTIDISKHEYCRDNVEADLDGFTVFVYSPPMLVAEKVRAICQQLPQYGPIVKRSRAGTARARDFLDIHVGCEQLGVDFAEPRFQDILRQMFLAKHVPLALISQIESQREFHRPDFVSVAATVKPGFPLRSYDEYFEYVVGKCRTLEVLWKENPPA